MAFLDKPRRVFIGDGEWIDVLPLSVEEARVLQKKARASKASDGESKDEVTGYELLAAIRSRIVAWSDPAEVTPENTARLSIELNTRLMKELLEPEELPLASGSPSTAI